jgi:hypothetical protein
MKGPPTEAALLSVGGPRLLAAVALVHAERVTITGIKYSVNELWLCHRTGRTERWSLLDLKQGSRWSYAALPTRRERCSVSLSPINYPTDRAVMANLRPFVRPRHSN